MFQNLKFKVGLFTLVGIVIVSWMSVMLSKSPHVLGGSNRYVFKLNDASGLIKNGAVKMSGVSVGNIESIQLQGGLAEVWILVSSQLKLYEGTRVEIKSSGILGDRFVSLNNGLSSGALLPNSAELLTNESGGMEAAFAQAGDITTALKDVAEALRGASIHGDQSTSIGRIMGNLENITADMSQVTGHNMQKFEAIMGRLDRMSALMEDSLSADGGGAFKNTLSKAYDSVDRLDRSMANIEDVTKKIQTGEGTLGQLINDSQTIDKLNSTLNQVNDLLGGSKSIITSVDFHSEYLTSDSDFKTFVGLKIQPSLTRHYEFQVIQDPLGVSEKTHTLTETKTTTAGVTTVTQEEVAETETQKSKLKLTALFAKRYFDLTFKGGLIQSRGGVGVDYHLFDDRLSLSAEVFDFEDTHLRLFAKWNVLDGVYLVGGGDSILDSGPGFNPFIGAGLSVETDDLGVLATGLLR